MLINLPFACRMGSCSACKWLQFLQQKRKKKITWCRGWLVGSAKKFDMRLMAVTTMKTWQRKWEKAARREKRWKHED
jgi:hypothetical protein